MALIDKALATTRTSVLKPVAPVAEEIELALAWAEDRVTNHQVMAALGMKGYSGHNNRLYSFVSTRLREGFRKGTIQRRSK